MKPTNETLSIFISKDDISSQSVTEKKIQKFMELKEGWHYGEGVPFKDTVLKSAISLIHEARQLAFYETDAFPGLNGEVMVTIYYSKYYLEFTIEPNETVTFYQEMDREEIAYQEGLSMQDAKAKIKEFRKELWRESESLTVGTMTTDYVDLPVSHLRIQAGSTLESPLLITSASFKIIQLSADILGNITNQLQANPPFSGTSLQTYYHPVTG